MDDARNLIVGLTAALLLMAFFVAAGGLRLAIVLILVVLTGLWMMRQVDDYLGGRRR